MKPPRRPDPTHGVFETLLVLDGRPVELEAHLDRIATSLEALFGAALPVAADGLVRDRAAPLPLGRMRLTVAPAGGELACETAAAPVDAAIVFPPWERGAELRGIPFAGGLGRHKWADRSALPEPSEGTVPLLLDRGDEVLEAGWANVFVAIDGVLMTPPPDGRILPGIARGAAIEVARAEGIEVREQQLGREALLAADEVFLTGSVRGVEPARSLDGRALPATGELSRRVGDGLLRRWLDAPVAAAPPALAGAPQPGPLAR